MMEVVYEEDLAVYKLRDKAQNLYSLMAEHSGFINYNLNKLD